MKKIYLVVLSLMTPFTANAEWYNLRTISINPNNAATSPIKHLEAQIFAGGSSAALPLMTPNHMGSLNLSTQSSTYYYSPGSNSNSYLSLRVSQKASIAFTAITFNRLKCNYRLLFSLNTFDVKTGQINPTSPMSLKNLVAPITSDRDLGVSGNNFYSIPFNYTYPSRFLAAGEDGSSSVLVSRITSTSMDLLVTGGTSVVNNSSSGSIPDATLFYSGVQGVRIQSDCASGVAPTP